jgi:ABC-2 type transport system ATP-binding protein
MQLQLLHRSTGLTGFGTYHLATADGRCLTQRNLTPNKRYPLGKIVAPTGAGLPVNLPIAKGPITIAGTPTLTADVYTVIPRSAAYFALSVGKNPLTAKIVQNNTMPLREKSTARGVRRTIELPAIAVDVPAGQNLYLTVAPIADMYAGQRGPLPGVMMLKNGTLSVRLLH